MTDGDIVRRIAFSATGQGLDSTTQAVMALGNALSDAPSAADLTATIVATVKKARSGNNW
jgi:hypothetical protein